MEDLQAYVPNLTMTEAGLGTSIYIRGIGSGENQGFEQSVGTYIDGIYYGRAQLSRAPFLDLAQVEVLRGPQNILYGKNSIGGAISVKTANPSDDFEGLVSVTYEPRFNEQTGDLVLSGPVSDTLGLRFAMRVRRSDGYMENQINGDDQPRRDDATLRLKGLWDISDTMTGTFKMEYGQFSANGRQTEVINDEPAGPREDGTEANPLFDGRTYGEIMNDTNVGFTNPLNGQTIGVALNEDDAVLDHTADFKGAQQKDYSDNKTYNLTAQIDFSVGEHNFNWISGYLQYKYDEECDCDYSGVDLFRLALNEEYSQFSQELRWLSPLGGTWEFIGGAYLQYSDLDFFDSILVESDVIAQVVNAADATEGGARGDIDPDPTAPLGSAENLGVGDAGTALLNIRSPRYFDSESKIASMFLQGTWNISDAFKLTLGGRLTYENKTGARDLNFAFPDGSIQPISEVDTAAAISFAAERHDLKGERSETQFSPLINLKWYVNEEIMMYSNISQGAKAGGYDARSNSSPEFNVVVANPNAAAPSDHRILPGSFEYEPEEASSFELGVKMGILDGAGEINAAMFYTQFDDLQVSVFDGTLGFNVGNAASAISKGIEFDGRLALSENWLLAGGLSLLSFKYEDHLAGTCTQGQTPTSPNGINCDYTGKTGQYVADYTGNILLSYETPVFDALMLRANIDALFTDDYNPSPNLDPTVAQDGYVQYNGRVALASQDGVWDVALVGKNLSDELILVYTQDLPSAYTITQAKTHFGFVAPRRTISLQASYRF